MVTGAHRSEGRIQLSPHVSPPTKPLPRRRPASPTGEGGQGEETRQYLPPCLGPPSLPALPMEQNKVSGSSATSAHCHQNISTPVTFQQRQPSMVPPAKDISDFSSPPGQTAADSAPEWGGEPLVLAPRQRGSWDSTDRASGTLYRAASGGRGRPQKQVQSVK